MFCSNPKSTKTQNKNETENIDKTIIKQSLLPCYRTSHERMNFFQFEKGRQQKGESTYMSLKICLVPASSRLENFEFY